tara:strand:- start:54 stop:380 length:327 start_codon:yes stop_codon:yes gene_type:complete
MMKYVTSFRVMPVSRSNKLKENSLISVSGIWLEDISSITNLEPSATGAMVSDPKPCPKAFVVPRENAIIITNNERNIFENRIYKVLALNPNVKAFVLLLSLIDHVFFI